MFEFSVTFFFQLKESEIGSKKTLESIKDAEALVESLELAIEEENKLKLYEEVLSIFPLRQLITFSFRNYAKATR